MVCGLAISGPQPFLGHVIVVTNNDIVLFFYYFRLHLPKKWYVASPKAKYDQKWYGKKHVDTLDHFPLVPAMGKLDAIAVGQNNSSKLAGQFVFVTFLFPFNKSDIKTGEVS